MTNGEKIKQMFPEIEIESYISVIKAHGWKYDISANKDWWNSAYKKPTKNDLGIDLIPKEKVMQILQEHWLSGTVAHRIIAEIGNDIQRLPSVSQEPILDKINKMKSEIASSLEFWDYSPNNNPLARDMLETLTYFWGDIREVEK